MRLRNTDRRYGAIAQLFHWGVVLLVATMFGLGWYMRGLPIGTEAFELFNLHKSLGLVVLFLGVLRLGWRLASPPPPLSRDMPSIERFGAKGAHLALYLLLFLQPVSGLVMSFASGLPTVIFGTWNLPSPIAPNNALKEAFVVVHLWSSWTIAGIVGLHAAAALRHHYMLGDDTLRRMLPGSR